MDLIIGTYTEDLPHLEGRSEGMTGVTYDDDGSLGSVTVLAKVRNSSWVVASADGRFVYTVSETVDFEGKPGGGVSAFARDLATGSLTPLNTASSAGVEPAHAAIDPSGRFLLVANYRSGSVAVFALGADGSIGELVDLMQDEGSSVHPKRQTGPHAHQIAFPTWDWTRCCSSSSQPKES
jgi:6-phosphogluconolactonase